MGLPQLNDGLMLDEIDEDLEGYVYFEFVKVSRDYFLHEFIFAFRS